MKIRQVAIALIAGLIMAFTAMGQATQTQTVSPTAPEAAPKGQLEPKKDGVVRIGVVTIKTSLKQDPSGQSTSEIIRTRWYSFLGGPTIELVPIDARLPQQVNIEAGQKECDYVLYSSVSQKTTSSLFGSFIKTATPSLTSAIPVGIGAGAAPSIRNSVQKGATDAATNMANQAASKITAKDQVTLDFIFVKTGTSDVLLNKSLKAKAKTDGEDIFSTLIEQAAGQILEATVKG